MKKLIFTSILIGLVKIALGQATADLNGVTFGFGAGYSYKFNKTYDYSLTTDANHNLIMQPLSKQAFVISSVIMVKLGKLAVDQNSNTLIKQSSKSEYALQKAGAMDSKKSLTQKLSALSNQLQLNQNDKNKSNQTQHQIDSVKLALKELKNSENESKGMNFWSHLSINLALNLVDVAPNVSFNKNTDGGLGLGYFITENLQAAVFYDVSRVSQLRDYVVNTYQGKPIPNGNGTYYNALDPNDNNLFYNKTVSGLSFKLIFSLANKTTPPSSTATTQ